MSRQLLLAEYKLTFRYTVSGFQHALNVLCDVVSSADPSGYDLLHQAGTVNCPVSAADVGVFTMMAPFYDPADASFDDVTLWHLVGGSYVYVYAYATAQVPTGSSGFDASMGICLSGKDQHNRRFPVYLYEGAFGLSHKDTSYAALNTANKNLIDVFWNVGGSFDHFYPWSYRLTRDSTGHTGRWLANVIDSNQKLRRARRIA